MESKKTILKGNRRTRIYHRLALLVAICGSLGCGFSKQPTTRAKNDIEIYGGLPKAPGMRKRELGEPIVRKTEFTPTALCWDGKYTFSRSVDFACLGHDGVQEWTFGSDIEIKSTDADFERYYED